ncbi:MAG: N-acetylmuramoyl-L-alanine amidase [Bacteroidetes bacterium]|nr:MAG: N-acetylmuramoyl-L-alanine amidase [Bacteroidota bacterium]REK00047.1 MAG: N-acetylmuramoyl-L-alanine amidase [Bacteroidota bacterium]REK35772.1 MAG: N-acetylmuramoyl-L-alanine amidase [Bacteroidota bacterium]REK49355.1 MAG: N-acetylmuramoyl-L-alanine amidase [Bacteroidota bacterium]
MSLMLTFFCLLPEYSFSPPPAPAYTLGKVVIDAGHGGHDSGCLGSKFKEKDIALNIALALGKMIEEQFPDVKVIYTRKKDVFVELHERASIANTAKADLFISIHCNSACFYDKKKRKEMCNKETQGAETWVMGLHKTEANLEVSKRENEVVLLEKDYTRQYDGFDPNSPEANIIFSLYQNAFLDQSLKMASYVQQEFKEINRNNRGVKQAGFLVLYKTSMPSILIETGFLSHPAEELYLGSEKGQKEITQAVFKAFRSYKKAMEFGLSRQEPKAQEKEVQQKKSETDSVKERPQVKENPSVKEVQPQKENTPVKPQEKPAEIVETPRDVPLFGVQFLLSKVSLKKNDPAFKGIKDVMEEFDNGFYKYTSGRIRSLDDAVTLQMMLRESGFPDAFVVAYLNDKRISLKEARQMLVNSN